MRTNIFTIILFLTVCGLAQAQLEILEVPAGSEPVIDGLIDDSDPWTEESWIPMEFEVSASTTHDASSRFQILHNVEIIYIVQQVVDTTPNNDAVAIPNPWERDCIEIFFHMSDDVSGGTYTPSTSQLRFVRDGDGEAGFDGTAAIVSALQADDNFEWMITTDDEGWVFEGAFPIETLDAGTLFNYTDMFFEIKATDNTNGQAGGRTQQLYWGNANDDQWSTLTNWTAAILSTTQIEVPSAIAEVEVGTGSVYVAGNMLRFRNIEGTVSIYNITGSLVKTDVIERNGSIEISSLNSGVYFVKTEAMTAKFVK